MLSATPRLNPDDRRERIKLTGELPSPLNPPPGCAFNARCRLALRPYQSQPQLKDYGGQLVACFAVDQDENPQRQPQNRGHALRFIQSASTVATSIAKCRTAESARL
ncbi:oligopeptide/dipeptide ABC transporter ATP-binding protein [Escherichia coli]